MANAFAAGIAAEIGNGTSLRPKPSSNPGTASRFSARTDEDGVHGASFLDCCRNLGLGPIVKRAVGVAGISDDAAVKQNHRVSFLISSQLFVNRSGLLSIAAIASAKVGLRRGNSTFLSRTSFSPRASGS